MSTQPASIAILREFIDEHFPDKKHLVRLRYTDNSNSRIRMVVEKEWMIPDKIIRYLQNALGYEFEAIPDMFHDIFEIS